jgi:hypothetical protein
MPDDLVIAIREKKQLVTISATPKLELVESRDSHNTVDSVIPDSASGWSAKAPSSQSSAASGTSKSITTLVVRGFSPGNTIQQQPKKQSLFKEEAATRTVRRVIQENQPFDDDVFETDEEDIDESAIDDDDDSSDWEDSNEDSDNVGIDEKTFFQRVDSRPRLASCRSLLTVALHQNDRTNGLTNQAVRASRSTPAQQRSRASSPNGPSLAPFPDSGEAPLTMKKSPLKAIAEVPRTEPHLIPHSPSTTRRNMLATELTVSLRQHLLWEQQQKFQTVNAVLKRRRIARDVTSLKQYPEMSYMRKDANEIKTSYWNQYFSQRIGDYNSEGW